MRLSQWPPNSPFGEDEVLRSSCSETRGFIFSSSGHDSDSPWLYWQRLTDTLPARQESFPLWYGRHSDFHFSPAFAKHTSFSVLDSKRIL